MSIAPAEIFCISALAYLLCLCALLSLVRSSLPGVRAVAAACGLAIVSMACFWTALRSERPPMLQVTLGSFGLLVALLCLYVGFCGLCGRPVSTRLLGGASAVFTVVFFVSLVARPTTSARIVDYAVVHAVLLLALVRVVWPRRRPDPMAYGRWFVIVTLLLEVAAQAGRIVVIGTGIERPTGQITALRADGSEVARWGLLDVLPVSWQGPSLDAGNPSVATEVLEIAHHGFTD